jgi:rubrerythrin
MLDQDTGPLPQLVRLPRLIAGEWRCVECGHLSYGDSDAPRCPSCQGHRLTPTVKESAAMGRRDRDAARALASS